MLDREDTGYRVLGATPPVRSRAYALPKNSPPDCFYPPATGTVAFESLMTIPNQKGEGGIFGYPPHLFGGADDDMDEQSEICLFSAFSAALIFSKGMFSFETGFLPVLRISL